MTSLVSSFILRRELKRRSFWWPHLKWHPLSRLLFQDWFNERRCDGNAVTLSLLSFWPSRTLKSSVSVYCFWLIFSLSAFLSNNETRNLALPKCHYLTNKKLSRVISGFLDGLIWGWFAMPDSPDFKRQNRTLLFFSIPADSPVSILQNMLFFKQYAMRGWALHWLLL